MKHIDKQLMYKYIDKETDNNENIEIESHLEICDICKKEFEELNSFISNIHNIPKYNFDNTLLYSIKNNYFNVKLLFSKLNYAMLVISIVIGLFVGYLLTDTSINNLDLPTTILSDIPEYSITQNFIDIDNYFSTE